VSALSSIEGRIDRALAINEPVDEDGLAGVVLRVALDRRERLVAAAAEHHARDSMDTLLFAEVTALAAPEVQRWTAQSTSTTVGCRCVGVA
jgi:hypothetical protein